MDEGKRLTIERWMVKAAHDIQTAETVMEQHPALSDIVCFHCQQCAEKALKAFLVSVS